MKKRTPAQEQVYCTAGNHLISPADWRSQYNMCAACYDEVSGVEDETMGLEELRAAMDAEEEIEYHLTGNERSTVRVAPIPGWHSCVVEHIRRNGTVEIVLTDFDLGVTVLKKNIAIAFRRKAQVQDA